MKMHLAAVVPNEGARLLAQWIMRECAGDLHKAARRIFIDVVPLTRLLDGSMSPGELLMHGLVWRTGSATRPRDWYRPAECGWFETPAAQIAGGRSDLRKAA